MKQESEVKYQGLSLPVTLINEIKNHIKKHLEYKGVTEFVREAIRDKMKKETSNQRKKSSSGVQIAVATSDGKIKLMSLDEIKREVDDEIIYL